VLTPLHPNTSEAACVAGSATVATGVLVLPKQLSPTLPGAGFQGIFPAFTLPVQGSGLPSVPRDDAITASTGLTQPAKTLSRLPCHLATLDDAGLDLADDVAAVTAA